MENPEEVLPEFLSSLFSTSSPATELGSLKSIHKQLRCLSSALDKSESDGDIKFLLSAQDGSPYPDVNIRSLCKTQNLLNKFTCYLFERRFGWSESNQDHVGRRVRRLSCTGVTLEASDGQQKAFINDLIDSLLQWILHQKITEEMLLALEYTLKQVSNLPVVRNRAVVHIMDWLKENRESLDTCSSCPIILRLIEMSLTDVWSAIRNSCAKQLGHITPYLPNKYQEELFKILVTICKCLNSSWQAKEGAIMGISAMVHHCNDRKNVNFDLDEEVTKSSAPQFISSQVHDVVFTLLYNPQLTIREHAAKAISAYISSANMQEALSTFGQVLLVLRNGRSIADGVTDIILPVEFLDDYASEGFLNVSLFILKTLPLNILLPKWSEYISTFLLYLSHPASSVRQAASNIFKYLVAKSSHCVVLVKLVLQCLIEGWEPDLSQLTRPDDHHHGTMCNGHVTSVTSVKSSQLLDAWESKEGRLFAYELIMKYLLKNHWLYTFGPAGANYVDKYQNGEPEQDCSGDGINGVNDQGQGHKVLNKSHTVDAGHEYGPQYNRAQENTHRNSHSLSENPDSPCNHSGSQVQEDVFIQGPSQFDTTYSILHQIQVLEKSSYKNNQNSSKHHMHASSLEDMEKLLKSSPQNNSSIEEILQRDVGIVDVDCLSNILITVLHQTLHCMADKQWELRRMAKQVLPCLAEVIRWYDISILETIWKSYLPKKTCLLTYAAAVILKESVVHSIKLLPLLQRPPNAWQDYDMCKKIISKIVNNITGDLQSYLPYMDTLLQRPVFDRLSVVSACSIIAAHSYFNIPTEQRFSQIATVLSFWKLLFCFSHPNTRISKELLQGTDIRLFTSPFDGYLSCCLVKPEGKLQCAKQVEKFFVNEVHQGIKPFLLSLPVESSSLMLPVVAHYAGLFIDNTHVCKAMCDCVNTLGGKITDFISGLTEEPQMQACLKCIHLTLKELAAIITMKSADLHLVQKILSAYLVLCKVINPSRHIRIILMAICSRVSDSVYFNMEHSPRLEDDFTLLSNDIPLSGSPDSLDDWDNIDTAIKVSSPGSFPECLTLNLSNNSGSLPSGRLSALSQQSDRGGNKSDSESEGESSDWDSWDEEPEGHTALNQTFLDFLQKLKKICNSGSTETFAVEVKKLDSRERSLIKGILEW